MCVVPLPWDYSGISECRDPDLARQDCTPIRQPSFAQDLSHCHNLVLIEFESICHAKRTINVNHEQNALATIADFEPIWIREDHSTASFAVVSDLLE
jgi:hypothetical protein